MYYYTIRQTPRSHQLSMEDLWEQEVDVSNWHAPKATTSTLTRTIEEIPSRLSRTVMVSYLVRRLMDFCNKYRHLRDGEVINMPDGTTKTVDVHRLYETFYIPKKSGGLRTINAPHEDLKAALRELKDIFERDFHVLYHTAAFAYIPNRSIINSLQRHQLNQSKWFLKTDFTDFFGSTTLDFLMHMLDMIFPFCLVTRSDSGRNALRTALSMCMLDGGLPQGTPISPMLTNLMMVPIDHRLFNEFHERGIVYTRYADDCLMSSKVGFMFTEQVQLINKVLSEFQAPFVIKDKKTRYGSSAGSNWNLGLMLNKDNEITIGYKNAQRFNAMCNNYIADRKNGKVWDYESLSHFRGLISYYMMVERNYIMSTIMFYNQKYNVDMLMMLKRDLGGHGRTA